LHRCIGFTIQRFNGSTIQRFLVLCALICPWPALAQFQPPAAVPVRSVSGQFIVIGTRQVSPLAGQPGIAGNPDFVRLEPALLAVSAERIQESLRRELGINADVRWRGEISLALHSAQSPDEDVTIVSMPFAGSWNYRVQLPDVLSRARFMRAMTGVLLLEFANRNAGAHPAEIPNWLIDGLSQELLATGLSEMILSSPDKIVNDLPVTQIDANHRGFDPLAGARRALQNQPALTFEQLSWPSGAQLSGADGGAYRASAQLFVHELLDLKNGAAKLRSMLETLPQVYNWQTAFQSAFRGNFQQPLDVEKWWALRVVSFAARDPGPQWTPAVSRDNLDRILSVPVEIRDASNSLPAPAEASLQAVIRNFDPAQQTAVLQAALRDLGLAQLRMAPRLSALTGDYRRAIADYLGRRDETAPASHRVKHTPVTPQRADDATILDKLDTLDAQRRAIEAGIKPDAVTP
jgi:hypothetical protein